ncbi:hypothetical protein AB2B41_22220 [Marimonas sp. MJW-29]|uniref:Uncharacterized protein n=1 Tax=Sulfitobacter sediminis TaxID=3234186 RepID=A0ABV3RTQ6_9RHOB
MEIFRSETSTRDGTEVTSIRADLKADGGLLVHGQDLGPSVEKIFGDIDYEYWLDIDEASIPQLFILVLKEAFNSDGALTLERLRDIARSGGINVKFGNWI